MTELNILDIKNIENIEVLNALSVAVEKQKAEINTEGTRAQIMARKAFHEWIEKVETKLKEVKSCQTIFDIDIHDDHIKYGLRDYYETQGFEITLWSSTIRLKLPKIQYK